MMRTRPLLSLAYGLLLALGCSQQTGSLTRGPLDTALYKGMGQHRRPVTTSSPLAQKYFNQGLVWAYAFNHNAAIRSFEKATQADPECAMAWWGIALCNGPHINNPAMSDEQSEAAFSALQQAIKHIDKTRPVEHDLILALSNRYAKPWPEDRTALNHAYAEAMANVYANHPKDPDVGTLYAEALMNLKPWDLYTQQGEPREGTDEIVFLLEKVMKLDPHNPGANHLYIHAVEPSATPERGLPAADRLRNMVYASGHLLHMPSHIDVLVGQWNEAIVQNRKAMRSDENYRRTAPPQRFQHLYMSHNSHMLAFAAMMSGREREALEAARSILEDVPNDALHDVAPYLDYMMCGVYDVQKRFGRWDAILTEAPPQPFLPISTAMWRANRAIAYAAKKDFVSAELEHEAFRRVVARIPEDHVAVINPTQKVLAIAEHLVTGEIALQKGDLKRAAYELEKGTVIEDSLLYMEPPEWIQPIRHTLGAVYLKDQRFDDAERIYREDLEKWPNNGWSLYGLMRALEGQGKMTEASAARTRFKEAWKYADEPIMTSCKCIPKT
jgi:tetratricopeptide (TPR) repeat protein